METETFHWINMDSRSAVALYEAFALSTRALPFSESAGKPSGWSSLVVTTQGLGLQMRRHAMNLPSSSPRCSATTRGAMSMNQKILLCMQNFNQSAVLLWISQVIVFHHTAFCSLWVLINWQGSKSKLATSLSEPAGSCQKKQPNRQHHAA